MCADKKAEFVHLHIHSDYSMLDGACDVSPLCKHAAKLDMSAIAMTDHGNIFGTVYFFNAAKDAGIKPILGCELYVCKEEDHRQLPQPGQQFSYNHLIVLAENEEGYRNLVRICSEAALNGFYYKPRISKRFLAEHSKGLICLSACLKGEVAELLVKNDFAAAKRVAKEYEDIFGKGNYFLEIQEHGLPEDRQIAKPLFQLEKELDIPMLATNDSHYICQDDSMAQDVMVCIQTGKSVHDENRMKFSTSEFYVKSADEMYQLYKGYEWVCKNTLMVAERCNLKLHKVDNPWPKFDVPEGYDNVSYFEKIARDGLVTRKRQIDLLRERGVLKHEFDEYEKRLDYEIGIIKQMQYTGYFLIVWDFIDYARQKGVPVGPGRGSAAGSLVGYCMGITDVDPLQNNLLFERFLNPERVSMPDIDVDFCMNRRGEMIEYVTRKYGREQVAQIITFGTLAAKASIKDVGRVLDMPYAEVDRVAKMVPGTPGMTIDKAFKESPQLAEAYEKEESTKQLIDTAKKLEGMVRNSGVHASAVVIAPSPLHDMVPLFKTKNDEIVTAYDMKAVEKMGLLKMDFLGLTTLTILDDCLKLIEQTHGVKVDMDTIDTEDQQIYETVFHKGHTSGVFQFESDGMRDVLRRYKPTSLDDLTALNALYRPGPIQGGMIDDFIDRKWGRKKVEYHHPCMEQILKETLGVIVYQEQVMQISAAMSGYSLGEADLLRRAMGKKIPEEMVKQRVRFMEGAKARDIDPKIAGEVFDLMEQFAGYGFNKSHSAAYGVVAYRTAYLKTRYPVEFMAALLTSVADRTDDVVKYVNECREMGIEVLSPDINESLSSFTPITEQKMRFGLAAIKNVGMNAIQSIIDARKEHGRFTSIFQFCEKVDLRLLNKRVVESLLKGGAFDSLGRRAQIAAVLDKAIDSALKAQKDLASGQHGLFGIFDDAPSADADRLPDVPDWDEALRLQNEKDVLGFWISGHPLDKHRGKIADLQAVSVEEIMKMKRSTAKGEEIKMVGMLSAAVVKKSRKGDLWAMISVEDMTGKLDGMVFPEAFKRLGDKVKIESPVYLGVAVRVEDGSTPKVAINDITPLDDAKVKLPRAMRVEVDMSTVTEEALEKLHELFVANPGEGKVLFDMVRRGQYQVILEPNAKYGVTANSEFRERVDELLGKGSMRVVG